MNTGCERAAADLLAALQFLFARIVDSEHHAVGGR
jgi:hypothetical protein